MFWCYKHRVYHERARYECAIPYPIGSKIKKSILTFYTKYSSIFNRAIEVKDSSSMWQMNISGNCNKVPRYQKPASFLEIKLIAFLRHNGL
jgi:hypothetical protein